MTDRPRRPPRTAEEQARIDEVRERFRGDPASLREYLDSDRFGEPTTLGLYYDVKQMLDALKAIREGSGLTLADVAERSGLDPAAISRLENGKSANPTVGTLGRYTSALGKRLAWTIEDAGFAP